MSDIFATRSPKLKELGLVDQSLSDDDRLRLMLGYPQLIRRPLVTVGDELVVGYDAPQLEAALR